jgi:hypothetical protein
MVHSPATARSSKVGSPLPFASLLQRYARGSSLPYSYIWQHLPIIKV